MDLTNKWMNDPQYLAQVGHFLGGLALIFASAVFGGQAGMWVTLVLGIGAAATKEFWYDMKYELPKQTWKDSIMDFGFYMLGGAVGVGLSFLAAHCHRIAF